MIQIAPAPFQNTVPSADRRRAERWPIRLPVTLIQGARAEGRVIEDVSFGGLFLATEIFPGQRRLIRFRAFLPTTSRELTAHGMVVHWVEPGNAGGHPAGIGVQLYAMDRAALDAWAQFVSHVRRQAQEEAEEIRILAPEIG